MAGKITIGSKTISRPFIPFATGPHAGKQVTAITTGGKTLTLQFPIKSYSASSSAESFSHGGLTVAKSYVTFFSDWGSKTYKHSSGTQFLLEAGKETDPSSNMVDLMGNPYYAFYRYGKHNNWAQESHWADNHKQMINLAAVKKFCSGEGEYLSFQLMVGTTRVESRIFDYDQKHSTKDYSLRYHNGQLQILAAASGGTGGIVNDVVYNDWTNLGEGSHEMSHYNGFNAGIKDIKTGIWVDSAHNAFNFYSVLYYIWYLGWYGITNVVLHTRTPQ